MRKFDDFVDSQFVVRCDFLLTLRGVLRVRIVFCRRSIPFDVELKTGACFERAWIALSNAAERYPRSRFRGGHRRNCDTVAVNFAVDFVGCNQVAYARFATRVRHDRRSMLRATNDPRAAVAEHGSSPLLAGMRSAMSERRCNLAGQRYMQLRAPCAAQRRMQTKYVPDETCRAFAIVHVRREIGCGVCDRAGRCVIATSARVGSQLQRKIQGGRHGLVTPVTRLSG